MSREMVLAGGMEYAVMQCLKDSLAQGDGITIIVQGLCMEPSLNNREQIRIKAARHYWPGDIVAYYSRGKKKRFVHRLLGPVRTRGRCGYLAIGDNSIIPDVMTGRDNLLGKVVERSKTPYRASARERFQAVTRYLYYGIKVWRRNL